VGARSIRQCYKRLPELVPKNLRLVIMSLARQFAAAGQIATAAIEEDEVKNLTNGRNFRAKIEPISDIELLTELGVDNREVVMIHTRDSAAAAEINSQDVMSAIGRKFKMIRRVNNPASLHMDFAAVKGVPGKDDWA